MSGIFGVPPFPLSAAAEAALGKSTGNATADQQKELRQQIGAEPYSTAALPGVTAGVVGSDGNMSVTSGELLPTQYGAKWVWAGIMHVLIYGQSLGEGAWSAIISLIQNYLNVMFNTYVRGRPVDGSSPTPTSFVELVSTADSASIGEVPVTGTCNTLSRLLAADGLDPLKYRFLASSAARGGQNLDTLKIGGPDWIRVRDQIANARNLALAAHMDYSLMAFMWFQGEADLQSNPDSYGITLAAMRAEIQRYGSCIGGTGHTIGMFAYQCTDEAGTVANKVGSLRGLLAARRLDPNIYIIFPKGCLSKPQHGHNLLHDDFVHLSGIGSRLGGAKGGQIIKKVVVDGESDWRGVEITGVKIIEDMVFIDYNVPVPPLVLDSTDLMYAITNSGYKITDSTGVLTISSVAVVNQTRVQIICSRTLVGTVTLRYGMDYSHGSYGVINGGCGNLRDSDPFYEPWDDGGGVDNYRLPNWAISQDWTVALN